MLMSDQKLPSLATLNRLGKRTLADLILAKGTTG
jgi:hypothetical protein